MATELILPAPEVGIPRIALDKVPILVLALSIEEVSISENFCIAVLTFVAAVLETSPISCIAEVIAETSNIGSSPPPPAPCPLSEPLLLLFPLSPFAVKVTLVAERLIESRGVIVKVVASI